MYVHSQREKNFSKLVEKLKREFNFENGDLFRYLQLRHFHDTEIKKGIYEGGNEVTEVLAGVYKLSPSKIVSKL